MHSREEMSPPEEKMELFLSDLALNGHCGHNALSTMLIDTHVVRQGCGTRSPLDDL